MGADGHLYLVRPEDVNSRFEGLDPAKVGYRQKTLFGMDLLWTYNDTDGRGERWPLNDPDELWHELERARYTLSRIPEGQPSARLGNNIFRYVTREDCEERIAGVLERMSKAGYDEETCRQYAEFRAWLDANALDWTVWT